LFAGESSRLEVITITTRIKSHILEKVIGTLMAVFGIAALFIFFSTLKQDLVSAELAMIEILLIIVLAILAQTIVLIRIYEQNQER
jgi:hypothetical protein